MPPRVMFQKEEVVRAALSVTRRAGIGAVTAREVARELHVSVGPIFTWFGSMEELRRAVWEQAKGIYRDWLRRGLEEPIPFLGVGRQYIRFAKEEPELYKLLFLTRPDESGGGAAEALRLSQDLARESLMRIYRMDAETADRYFRDLWLVAFSLATMTVTGTCPFTDAEMTAILSEISLSVCKAYKEIPGLPEGRYDKDRIFAKLVGARENERRGESPGDGGTEHAETQAL
ncbi:MAG: TetR/AcrR family transcriptional regulator [Clostridia bacterium]|nr:TetR/AcrR family transcriptional regulator [Clostridia bacterium]